MPWTKINYPNSMKNLPVKVRTKAIEIANAMLKEHPKMDEGEIIATATKNAKGVTNKKKVPSLSKMESHQIENMFHHKEEVELHQEHKKVVESNATRRNAKRYFRIKGQK